MSVFDRIVPWRRGRIQRTWLVGETHAARDRLASSLEQIAQAMEERFLTVFERLDEDREARAVARAELDIAVSEMRRSLEAQLASLSAIIEAGHSDKAFTTALRELKRDLAAQISLGAYDAAVEMQGVASALTRTLGERSAEPSRPPPAALQNSKP